MTVTFNFATNHAGTGSNLSYMHGQMEVKLAADVYVPPNGQYVDLEQLLVEDSEGFMDAVKGWLESKLPVFEGRVQLLSTFRMEPKYYYEQPAQQALPDMPVPPGAGPENNGSSV